MKERIWVSKNDFLNKCYHGSEYSRGTIPANQTIQIMSDALIGKDTKYQFFDVGGKIVGQGKLDAGAIDVSALIKGVYF